MAGGMLPPSTPSAPRHPQGECVGRVPAGQNDTFSVQTAGGLFHVRWDHDSRISANGGMVHFAQFLEAAKVFDDWAADCPLSYESNRAHDVRDILGTWLLSAVNGHWRYAHITALRGDSVNPQLLRMRRVASEDAVRRALRRMDPEAARFWAQRHLLKTMAPLMSLPWILDIDVTIKSLYGYQEGSLVGHNPHKPGRPSHALHTFLLAKARLVLEVSVHAGDEHTSASTRGDLFGWLEKIPRHLWPSMLRGDCAYGTEDMMAWPVSCHQFNRNNSGRFCGGLEHRRGFRRNAGFRRLGIGADRAPALLASKGCDLSKGGAGHAALSGFGMAWGSFGA